MKIYLIAGEPSGDSLGAPIVQSLPHCFGVGGPLMEAAGMKSLFNIKKSSVGGLTEVIPHLFKIKKLINLTVEDVLQKNPDVLLTIDSPGFCFRVAKLVRKKNPKIKLFHLVAPSVWAWRAGRAESLARLYDHLFTLFDFEPPYFTKHGLETTFVGHPAIERFVENDLPKDNTLLLMPGSRVQEINSLLPTFLEASKQLPFEKIVIPTLPHLVSLIESLTQGYPNLKIVTDEAEKVKIYSNAKLALVASGTATLQLALAGCPMIVCYRLSTLTYNLIKPFVKVKYISLVNLLLDRPVVPELIQADCSIEKIIDTFNRISMPGQMEQFKLLRAKLTPENGSPSQTLVETIHSKC